MERSGKPDGRRGPLPPEWWCAARAVMPWWKRAMDVSVAVSGLALLAPVFVALGIFIKAISPGSPFFRQERVGHRGVKFFMWKFRTMHPDADPARHQQLWTALVPREDGCGEGVAGKAMAKLEQDPRVIPFGDFLRRSGLDELPQLFNVLLGQMSLVGPRPPVPYETAWYQDGHWGRFNAVPGITGLWQVSGKNRLSFMEMVRLDIYYGQHVSPWLDLKIILKTPLAIRREFQRPGPI